MLNHHNPIADDVFIRDLCLLRENNIVVDDQDFTCTELTFMIDNFCTCNANAMLCASRRGTGRLSHVPDAGSNIRLYLSDICVRLYFEAFNVL